MNASERREEIIKTLKTQDEPICASSLASKFKVSRQVIVGDIALLRAKDYDIDATPRGYVLNMEKIYPYIGTIVCSHDKNDIEKELNIIVDNGGTCIDVMVPHKVYGDIVGTLNIKSRFDVKQLIDAMKGDVKPLSILSNEKIHLHHLGCDSKETFDRICICLEKEGLIYAE